MKESRGVVHWLVFIAVLVLGSAVAVTTCGSEEEGGGAESPATLEARTCDGTMADALADGAELSVHSEAVAAAGIDGTLAGTGPFTVGGPEGLPAAPSACGGRRVNFIGRWRRPARRRVAPRTGRHR